MPSKSQAQQKIAVSDPVAIRLWSDITTLRSEQETFDRFPELTTH